MRTATLTMAVALIVGFSASAARADPPPPMSTHDFVQAAAEADQFEMLEGRVANVEGRDPRVRAFAEQMIEDHAATTRALQQSAAAAGLPPPSMALSGDQAMLLGALQGQSGPDFDKTYVRHQVLGHEQALVVERGYAQGGSDASIRKAAQSAVPTVQHHLETARQLCGALNCNG